MMVFSGSLLPFFFFVIAEFMAMHKTTTSATLPTSSNPAPNHTSPVDCDFEESFCHWEVDTDPYRKKWTRKSKTARSTGVYGNDPLADHTLGNVYGHYVGLNNRYARSKGASNMTSPSVVIPEKGICFQFWYYMFGASVPSLKVFITPTQTTGNAESRVVWTSSGSQGINWKRSRLHIQDVQGEAYINIQAEYDKYSSIALDDLSMNYGHCPPSNLCDFEDDNLCSYTQEKSDDFDWSLSTPDSRAKQEGPKTDHTYETAAGHYAFINASIAQFAGKKASLESNPFPATTHSCLSFWYDMEGNSMGTLSVRVKSSSVTGNKNKNPRPIWTKTGDKEGGWLLANVDVSSAVEYNIVFDGIVGHSIQNTMMAIDDIRVRQGLCPEPNSCDFEEHTCMWRNNRQGDDADWEIVPTSFASGVGPKFDHTLYTSAGHYLYFDTRKLSRGDVAKISSPAFEKGKTYCLHFWYYINTDANFTIVIQEVNTNTENNLRLNTTHMNEKSWSVVRDTIGPFLNDFNVVFTGTMSVYQTFHGSIAVDDVSIQKGSCGTTPLPTQTKNAFRCPDGNFLSQREVCDFNEDCAGGDEELQCGYDCDFEKGTSCGWVASHYKYAAWIIQNGTRSEQEGGPSLDNTLNTVDGHFLYLTGNSNVFVHSPIFQKSAPSCEMVFALFYHNVPRSGLYIRKIVKDETIILFIPGSQNDHGPKWQHVIIPIGQSEVPFKIRFNGVGYRKASVAVDDIYFRNCEFPQPHVSCTDTNTFHCKNKGCVHPATVCNYLDDCGDGSDEAWEICQHYNRCDFESGMCEWSQATNGDDFDWILSDSVRSSWRPHADHTTSLQYGHYMSIKNTLYKRLPGDRAWLLSPVLKPTSHCTLTLYVFFDEYPSEQFSIYTRSEIGGPLTELVTKVGGGILAWTTVHLQFKSSIDFQIIIEGRFVLDGKGTMSVDDFVLSPGCNTSSKSLPLFTNLKPPTTPSPCGDIGKWQCADGSQCIYRFELCDFVTQCTDGSDEKDCGTCDFETSSCGWFDKTRGRYIWDRVNTSSNDIQGKPKTDHTHAGESIGSFMFIHSRGFGYTRPVLFESPVFGSTESDCFIRFYYYVPNSTGTLRLRLYPKDITSYEDGVSGVRLWYKSFVKKWTRATVSIGSRSAGFRLVFRYTFSREPGEKEQSIAAIDDISFSSECGMGRPSAVCKIGEFMCQQSKECKPLTARCDFAKDCFNGEDEKDCEKYLMTDFEQGVNENIFENDLRDINLYWIKTQPSSSSDEYAPDRDHTFGNETGHYMYIERGESSSTFAVARLKGPVILANKEGTCHMRLFYHLNGNYSNAINVYTENTEGGVLKRVWSVNNEEGNEWKRVDIQLDEFKPFRVIIEGVRDTDYRGDIGIDDVSFTPQCVKSSHSLPAYFPAPRHGSCKKDLEFTCDGKCVSVSKWCDFKVDCADKMDEITCPPQCDFEHGMCGWKNPSPRYSADWEIEQIKTGVDHKPGTSKGFVLKTTEGSTGRRYNVKAYLESHFFRASSYNCSFSFWMKKRGSNLKLDFKIRSFGVEEDFFSETIKKDNQEVWLHKTVMIPPCQKDFQLVLIFESRYRSNTDYLLLDDFSFNDCSVAPATERCKPGEFQCNNGVCILEDGLCDLVSDCCDDSDETVDVCHKYRKNTFENGMGGWKKKVGITTWKRQKAKPYLDHTFSSPDGHWISATCSKKTISVHEMPLPNEICVMRFWYAFLGTNGNITVFAKPFLGETKSVASFSAFSGIKAEWSIAEVKIDMHERYLLTLEGICNGYRSTIYIDDITFSPSCGFAPSKYLPPTSTPVTTKKTTIFDPCPNPDQFKCISDGDCIWKSQVCNFNIDCGDKSDEIGCNTISTCDFDVDLCGWQETEPDSLDWVRGSSTDVADNHGPRFDASGSSGNYVYIQNTNKGNLQTQIASLRSKDFPSAAAGCALEFYFFHLGSNPGTLLLKVIYGPKKEGVLWETSKKSDSWVKVIIGVGRRNSTFSLAFTRSPDSGPFTGLMAIDKIHFSSSCMELSVVDTNCPNEDLMFRCGRGACILKSQLCDGQDDCGDGSDESRQQCKGYSREDFETPTLPLGRLTQSINDELDWSVWNSSMSIPIGLLGVDHSSGLPQGHYLYVTGSPKMKKTDSARLQSNPFKATTSGNSCEVRFFVLLPSELQSVQVGYRAYNSNDSVSYENTNVNIFGSYWQHVAFTFENVSRPFVIVIKASPGHPEGSLAIDDVTFGPHCRPTDSSLHNAESTDDDSDGEWKTAVGVVIGLLGVVSLVAGGIFYLFRTGKIDGIRIRFERFVEEKSGRYDSSGSHDNPVYYDGRAVVNVQK